MKIIIAVFALIGLITSFYGIIGLSLDVLTFDQTKGGYEYPYEGWTGQPVDWTQMDVTPTGLVKRGYVIDVHVNGTTGMISFGIFGTQIDWQPFSDRALVVHQPREGLQKRGFDPQF